MQSSRPRLFIAAATTMFAMFVIAGAPTAILPVWQAQLGFGTGGLTFVFGIYSVATIAGLLFFGRAADQLGRKKVLLAAISLQLVALIGFIVVVNVELLIASRILQGLSTGIATSALSAVMVESLRPAQVRIATLAIAAAPAVGLGVGALGTGVAVVSIQYPELLIFGVMALTLTGAGMVIAASPETLALSERSRFRMRPHVAVARDAKGAFFRAVPVIIASWMLTGFGLGLAPSVMQEILSTDSPVIHGWAALLQSATVAIISLTLGTRRARSVTLWGGIAVIAGYATLTAGILSSSLLLLLVAMTVAGVGFGLSFSGVLGSLEGTTSDRERGSLFSAVYLIAYVAYGVPVMLLGQLTHWFPLSTPVMAYATLGTAAALLGLYMQWRTPHSFD